MARKPATRQGGRKPSPASASNVAPTFLDPATLPCTPYALRVAGSCMEPDIAHGSHVMMDPTLSVEAGDIAAFFVAPGFFAPGGSNVFLKRIVVNAMRGITFPYKAHPNSTAIPIFVVEQDNPRRRYQVPATQILGVHKCIGPVPAGVPLMEDFRSGRHA